MDMNAILEQARLMQQQLSDAQDSMGEIEVTGSAGGGAVSVVATADMRLTSVTIDPAVVDPKDTEMLEDLVLAAVNAALAAANDVANDRVAGITGGLSGLDLGSLF